MNQNNPSVGTLVDGLGALTPVVEKLGAIFNYGLKQSADDPQYAELQEELAAIDQKAQGWQEARRITGMMLRNVIPTDEYNIEKTKKTTAKTLPGGVEREQIRTNVNKNSDVGQYINSLSFDIAGMPNDPANIKDLNVTSVYTYGQFQSTMVLVGQEVRTIDGCDIVVATYDVNIEANGEPVKVASLELEVGLGYVAWNGYWERYNGKYCRIKPTYINQEPLWDRYGNGTNMQPYEFYLETFSVDFAWDPYEVFWAEDKYTFTFAADIGLLDKIDAVADLTLEPLEGAGVTTGTATLAIDRATSIAKLNMHPSDASIESASGGMAVIPYIIWVLGAIEIPFACKWGANSFTATFAHPDMDVVDMMYYIANVNGVPAPNDMLAARDLVLALVLGSMDFTAMIRTEVSE